LSTAFTFPFPFNFALASSTSFTFCVTLVIQHDGALDCDINGSGPRTLSLAGCRPMNSAVLYQLQVKYQQQDLPLGASSTSTLSPLDNLPA
jgi:hypothetical protein